MAIIVIASRSRTWCPAAPAGASASDSNRFGGSASYPAHQRARATLFLSRPASGPTSVPDSNRYPRRFSRDPRPWVRVPPPRDSSSDSTKGHIRSCRLAKLAMIPLGAASLLIARTASSQHAWCSPSASVVRSLPIAATSPPRSRAGFDIRPECRRTSPPWATGWRSSRTPTGEGATIHTVLPRLSRLSRNAAGDRANRCWPPTSTPCFSSPATTATTIRAESSGSWSRCGRAGPCRWSSSTSRIFATMRMLESPRSRRSPRASRCCRSALRPESGSRH